MAVRDGDLILLTGAAGRVAARLRVALRDRYRLRLTDLRELTGPGADGGPAEPVRAGESFIRGDLTEPGFAQRLVDGAAGIIHLAGEPDPGAGWEALLHRNLRATAVLLDAAADRGVPKLVYASSVHAAGGYNDPATWPVDPAWAPRPCCRYGVSKVAGEAMARLYADRVPGASAVVLRLGLVTFPPRWRHEVRGWLGDADLVQLVRVALDADIRHGLYFGVSRSERPRYRLDEAEREIGYHPREAAPTAGLNDERPAYPDDCRLWRIPDAALDAPDADPDRPVPDAPDVTPDADLRQPTRSTD